MQRQKALTINQHIQVKRAKRVGLFVCLFGPYCCSGRSGALRWSGPGSRWPGGGGRRWGTWRCRCRRWPARTTWGSGREPCGTWRSGRCWSGRSRRCGCLDTPRWSMTLREGRGKKGCRFRGLPISFCAHGLDGSYLLLHSPWYMTSRSGCPMQRAISRVHSSLYDFPSLPHTACFREMWEQSGEHTHWGLPIFILQTFPGLHLTPSQVSAEAQRAVSYVYEQTECSVTVVTSLQTSGDPQAFSHKTKLRSVEVGGGERGGGRFPETITQFSPCTMFTIITTLYWPLHTRSVSPGEVRGWRVFITHLCVRLHADWS